MRRKSDRLQGFAFLRHAGKPDEEKLRHGPAYDHQDGHRRRRMGIASRSARRTARVDSAARDGNARVRRSEDCRGAPQTEAKLLSCESPLQQLVVHIESSAAPGVGVPGTLGEQTHRHCRSDGARPRANESAERARLADMARLSVGYAPLARSPSLRAFSPKNQT